MYSQITSCILAAYYCILAAYYSILAAYYCILVAYYYILLYTSAYQHSIVEGEGGNLHMPVDAQASDCPH